MAIALPALAAVGSLFMLNAGLVAASRSADLMARSTEIMSQANATMAEVQIERGKTLLSLSSRDPGLIDKRKEQRSLTDQRRKSLDIAVAGLLTDLPPATATHWRSTLASLTALDDLRTQIDAGGASVDSVAATYGTAVQQLIALQESLQKVATTPDVARTIVELIRIVRMRESGGLERVLGARSLASGTISAAARQKLTELAIDQDVRFGNFKDIATAEQLAAAEQFETSPANQAMQTLRSNLAIGPATISPANWFDTATARLDLLRQIEDGRIAEIRTASIAESGKANHTLYLVTGLTLAAMIAAGIVMYFLAKSITTPIRQLTNRMAGLAAGDKDSAVPATERRDEIGDMSRAVLVFQQQAIAVARLTDEAEALRLRNEVDRRIALLAMAETVESETRQVIEAVSAESQKVNQTAGRMAHSAILVQENAAHVAAAAEQSLNNSQAVASASEQLSASIREIAGQVSQSIIIVSNAVDAARTASDTVERLSAAMLAIDQVVQVIADIASQTNLLALNATIEAARAGDAGKGFAVVANEVKILANQTARQTEDIGGRISTLKDMARDVFQAIAGVVEQINGVEQIAGSVAASVEEQDAATREIARNVQESTSAAGEVANRIVEVAQEAATTGEQANQVESLLASMAANVEELGHALNRVVRTATPDVDRRANPRFAIKNKAVAMLDGHQAEIELSDISVGGAAVVGLPPSAPGQACMVRLDKLELPASVVESGSMITRLKWPVEHEATVKNWISQHMAERQAA